MKDATLTDLTCIEELLNKLIKTDIFEKDVFRSLWDYYVNFGRNLSQISSTMPAEERKKYINDARAEQRSALQLLRMIGNNRVEVLLEHKA